MMSATTIRTRPAAVREHPSFMYIGAFFGSMEALPSAVSGTGCLLGEFIAGFLIGYF